MSVVEDVRKVLQDFLAPELHSITVRLDAIEKIMEVRFKELDSRIDARFNEVDSKFNEVDSKFSKVDSRFNEVSVRLQALQETVDRNDSAQKQLIAKLTQDFEFDKRLTEIERHIRLNNPTAA